MRPFPLPFSACLYDGIPLIYSGQEIPNLKRLLFFDKDEIDWDRNILLSEFYKTLLQLRKINPALKSGDPKRSALILSNTSADSVLSFIRRFERNEVLVILNLSADTQSVIITGHTLAGSFKDIFNSGNPDFISGQPLLLNAWDYKVYVK